jgi:hypothetical protein
MRAPHVTVATLAQVPGAAAGVTVTRVMAGPVSEITGPLAEQAAAGQAKGKTVVTLDN